MAEEQSLKMIRLEITDLEWLYKSYMSFVLGGGIFFFSNENFNIGDGILFVLTLKIDKIERKYPIRTEIIWKDERNGGGYGVALGQKEIGKEAHADIITLLDIMPDKETKRTFTM